MAQAGDDSNGGCVYTASMLPSPPPSPRSRAFWRQRDGLVLLAVLLLGSAAYVGLPDYHGRRGGVAELDGYYYYIYLRSLRVDGDLDFRNEYRDWGNPFGFGATSTGRARNVFGIGPALFWSPFFAAAEVGSALGRAAGSPISAEPMSRFHQRVTFFGSLVYGWLALLLCYLITRRLLGPPWALAASLGAALSGPLPYYCLGGSAYSHAPAAFATSLLVFCWLEHRAAPSRRSWLALGAATGLAVLARPAVAPFVLVPLWETGRLVIPALRREGLSGLRKLRDPLLGGALAVLVFSPQVIAWVLLYGKALLVPQGRGFLLFSDNAWLETLFAPRNGLLPSAPLLAAALAGLFLALRRRDLGVGLPLLLVFALVLFLNGAVHDWWGWNFSARRFTNALPIFAIGLATVLHRLGLVLERHPRRAVALLLGVPLAFAVLFNLEWLRQYTEKSLKWYSVRSSQGLYLTVTHGAVDRVYDKLGNPLSLPATLAFSARRGGSPRVYDRIQGSYLLGEINPDTMPAGKPYLHALMPLSSSRFRHNLSAAFGGARRAGKVGYVPLRAEAGHIFLPLNRPGELTLWLRAQARYPATIVELRFNGRSLGRYPLKTPGRWTTLRAKVPARTVARGINRLDVLHQLPPAWAARGEATVGLTGVVSAADVAVASGGKRAGRFCDFWWRERRFDCRRGINALVVDAKSGELLGRRGFDVHIYPNAWRELTRYLDHFPKGSIVALGTRDDVARHFDHGGAEALARIGAKAALGTCEDQGYAALGILGAKPGSAQEECAAGRHARARVGRLPPGWREAAWYSAIRLR